MLLLYLVGVGVLPHLGPFSVCACVCARTPGGRKGACRLWGRLGPRGRVCVCVGVCAYGAYAWARGEGRGGLRRAFASVTAWKHSFGVTYF